MQLIQNETGAALTWALMIGAGILVAGYIGLQTQQTTAMGEARTQADLDLAVLRASLVEILKDPTFCASALATANGGSAPAPLTVPSPTVTLTQINPSTLSPQPAGAMVIQTKPSPSTFNSLKISGIQLLLGASATVPGQYTGNFQVNVVMPSRALGTGASSISIPFTISASSPFTCSGGP